MKWKIALTVSCFLPTLLFSASGAWASQGPAPATDPFSESDTNTYVGTVGPIAIAPDNSDRIFVGTPNGGIWRTVNSGISWTPLTNQQRSLSIASLSFDPIDLTADTLVAGTGRTSNARIGTVSGGPLVGLLYTTDGGDSWNPLPGNTSLTASVLGAIARSTVLLAGTFDPQTPNNNGPQFGLYRSTNTGTSFTKITLPGQAVTSPISSLVGDFDSVLNPQNLWAAVTDPIGRSNTAVYASVNTGATWSQIFGAAESNGLIQNTTQTVLKVAKGPLNTLAVAVIDVGTDKITGVFYSNNNGMTWSQIYNLATATVDFNPEGQAVVNSAVIIDSDDSDIVYVAGTYHNNPGQGFPCSVYSFDTNLPVNSYIPIIVGAGNTFSHADSQYFGFIEATNTLLLSNDAGLCTKSPPSTGAWQTINGNISAMQGYSASYDANYNLLMLAAQDTGTTLQTAPNSLNYNTLNITGDGVNAVINDQTSATVSYYYSSSQELGELNRITNNGVVQPRQPLALTGGNPQAAFFAQLVLNRIDPSKIVVGGSSNGMNTYAVSLFQDDFVSTSFALTPVGNNLPAGPTIATPMDYGTLDAPDALLVGTNAGLFFSNDVPATLLEPVAAYPGSSLLTVAFDPRSSARFYVVDDSGQFYSSLDQGATFNNLTTQLPANLQGANSNRFAANFVSDNGVNAVFIAGSSNTPNQSPIAVADSDAAGVLTNYRTFGTGIPNTLIKEVSFNGKSDTLLANTLGRGIYLMYDATSNFPTATVLQFGFANNNSTPDATVLINGTSTSRPLLKRGPGVLTISGVATYTGTTTINGGTLTLTGAGNLDPATSIILSQAGTLLDISGAMTPLVIQDLSGVGGSDIAIGANTLTFGSANTTTFSGSISGNGTLVKENSGRIILNGISPFTGAITVSGGAFQINAPGSFAPTSITTVLAGATLQGTGTLGDINLSGTVSPGNSIGTLFVNNFTFNAGSNYLAEYISTTSDLIAATGLVTINPGSTLTTTSLDFNTPEVNAYTIITAAGGVTVNAPFTVVNLFPRFVFTVQYNPNDVQLIFGGFRPFAVSGNSSGVARCFNALLTNRSPDLNQVVNVLNVQTLQEWSHSFNQMQPSNFNNIAYAQENVAEAILRTFSHHVADCKKTRVDYKVWLTPFIEQVRQLGSGSHRGYKEHFSGFTLGADYRLPRHWWLTTGFSFADSRLNTSHNRMKASFDTYAGSLGSRYSDSAFSFDMLLSYLYSPIQGHRKMKFESSLPAIRRVAERKAVHAQGSSQALGHMGGSYAFTFNSPPRHDKHKLFPFVNFDYIYVSQNKYTERKAHTLDLSVHKKGSDLLRSEGGVGWSYCKGWHKTELFLDASASYTRESRFQGQKTKASFKGRSCQFTTKGLLPENNLLCSSLHFGFKLLDPILSITLGYHGEYGSRFILNAGDLEFKVDF